MENKGLIFQILGLVVVLILGFIEYSKPGDKTSFWLLISISIFVVLFIIYSYVKQKIDILEETKRKVNFLEQKLTFKESIHELYKRVMALEKNIRK